MAALKKLGGFGPAIAAGSDATDGEDWIPAFAGMTLVRGRKSGGIDAVALRRKKRRWGFDAPNVTSRHACPRRQPGEGRVQSPDFFRRCAAAQLEGRFCLAVVRVIDWMMQLEPEQAIIFKDELERLEAEKAMQYVTSVERIAKEQGRQEVRQGLISLLLLQLSQRFEQVPDWVAAKLQGASVETLEAWGARIFEARSLEEIFA